MFRIWPDIYDRKYLSSKILFFFDEYRSDQMIDIDERKIGNQAAYAI